MSLLITDCTMWNIEIEIKTEDESNVRGADSENGNVKVGLHDENVKTEVGSNMYSVDLENVECKNRKLETEISDTDSNMCHADLENVDMKVELDYGKVKTKTDSNMRNVNLEDGDTEIECKVKTETIETESKMCSAVSEYDFQFEDGILDTKNKIATSREFPERDLNCTSPGGHHNEENSNSYNCNYIDSYKFYLTCDRNTCIHCNEKFTTKIYLDDHTIRKHSKILECTFCTFTTTVKEFLGEHVLRHSETSTSHTRCMCIQCNATFKHKQSLDDHIIKKHPDCLATISSKIHECTYKTTLKSHLNRHLLQHSEAEDSHKLFTCIHCDSSFKCNRSLGNHIINRHPDFAASVSSKIHTCPYCAYKTTSKASLTKHMLRYSEHSTCITCNSVFKIKNQLDDYTKEDPDFISSDSSKILECTLCTMKTNMKRSLE